MRGQRQDKRGPFGTGEDADAETGKAPVSGSQRRRNCKEIPDITQFRRGADAHAKGGEFLHEADVRGSCD